MKRMTTIERFRQGEGREQRRLWGTILLNALDEIGVDPGETFLLAHPSVLDASTAKDGHCVYCEADIDPARDCRRIVGWERKARAASRKSGSDILCREAREEWACASCVDRLARGVSLGQESLAGIPPAA